MSTHRFVKRVLTIIFCFSLVYFSSFTGKVLAGDLHITAETSGYTHTSTYKEVMDFIYDAQKRSDLLHLLTLTTSFEGRTVPLLTISTEGVKSPRELLMTGKPAVLIMANIHAGEVEGKEACLMLLREFVNKREETLALLEHQVILLIPIFNCDGNDKMSANNRRDNGPETAGVRHNGQMLDLNRDYLKLQTPEVNGLVRVFNQWDPVLIVDMHTTNGSFHREPVTYTTQNSPNDDDTLANYMWNTLFPAVAKTLKNKYKYDSVPYGNFVDRTKPEEGWRNHAFEGRYGNNYEGLRNRFAILDENYSHAPFKDRVLGSFGFIKAILEFTNQHIVEMQKMVRAADLKTASDYYRQPFALEFKNEKLSDISLLSYEFELEKIKPEDREKYPPWYGEYIVKKTDKHKTYHLPYYSLAVPSRTIPLPEAYIIPAGMPEVVDNLKRHGIVVEKIRKALTCQAEVFITKEVKIAQRLYQGNAAVSLSGTYESKEMTVPENAYFVSMKQPLARLIPHLLEPESEDSLAAWGFMNRWLVPQWRRAPNPYPIWRILEVNVPVEKYQE